MCHISWAWLPAIERLCLSGSPLINPPHVQEWQSFINASHAEHPQRPLNRHPSPPKQLVGHASLTVYEACVKWPFIHKSPYQPTDPLVHQPTDPLHSSIPSDAVKYRADSCIQPTNHACMYRLIIDLVHSCTSSSLQGAGKGAANDPPPPYAPSTSSFFQQGAKTFEHTMPSKAVPQRAVSLPQCRYVGKRGACMFQDAFKI